MFSNIVLAYDGSNSSKKALEKAIEIAKINDAKLEVVHSLHNRAAILGEAIFTPSDDYEKDYLEHTQVIIDKLNDELSPIPNAKATLLIGNPVTTILNYAYDISADLVIVGNRGLSDVKEFFLGSVSHNLVQHSKIPVLVIK
ncbi:MULTISPECIES: universal stress protein [Paenibacillus]|uniref:Universal stress protein n=1 Tax=Paenibacillus radicis (ex Xue et al. 2023) TaxID=2972489 RepID=A0ABT1YN28_9BACL|nr:universal stress protein [Paenibacillus radicis (ex Xue et al. 2023)]MCR8634581.1 universal stress protein [Paenibacillus radicis (ex Xue et al. 2023)]